MPDTENSPTPPWGDNFDAEAAWRLVQNLRADLKESKADLRTERQARAAAEAKATENDPEGKVKAAEERARNAETALWTTKAIAEHPSLKGFEDLLSGDSEKAVLEKATRLASLGGGSTPPAEGGEPNGEQGEQDGEQPPADPPTLTQTPTPSLTPGHGGTEPEPFDPVKLAASIRG